MSEAIPSTFGTGSSVVVDRCQVCGSESLHSALFIGYLPPVNQMWEIGARPHEQPGYPAEFLYCDDCQLVQIGLVVDAQVLFPPGYPYTSGTTRILHENFAELQRECVELFDLKPSDLVVDIGSNDGTLLSKFQVAGHRVHGIEPTNAADLAVAAGIPTTKAFFSPDAARRAKAETGAAKVVTATNCFAHIENIDTIVEGVLELLAPDGLFVTESHYLVSLLETVQYDTIYHEHLRYYSLTSLTNLFARHDLEVVHARPIPTHGGSIRVYAARKGAHQARSSVAETLAAEAALGPLGEQLARFKARVIQSKLDLHAMFSRIKAEGGRIYGISAPSRASTLINYVGIDDGILDCVVEIKGSKKIGRYMPGTTIPVVEETALFEDQPEYALMLAWHIADELAPKLRKFGYKGKFIVPLPEPRII